MFEFAILLFELVTPLSETISSEDPIVCDDGSPPYSEKKEPNWSSCLIENCSPSTRICWSYRLDDCYDAAGRDLGVCRVRDAKCQNVFSCFDLWLRCVGKWGCQDSSTSIPGACNQGTCSTREGAGSPSAVGFGSPAGAFSADATLTEQP